MKKIKARGLRALIPIKPRTKPKRKKENVYYVEIKKIKLSREQVVREKEIDRKVIEELAKSIRKYGVIQPLFVVKVERKKKRGISVFYGLVEGQKRLLAAKEIGLKVVPAKIKSNV